MSLEISRAAIEAALVAWDAHDPDTPAQVSVAKALASEAANLATCEAVQFHGGIGMTDECDVGLYLKRARVSENLFGSAARHRERFAGLRGF